MQGLAKFTSVSSMFPDPGSLAALGEAFALALAGPLPGDEPPVRFSAFGFGIASEEAFTTTTGAAGVMTTSGSDPAAAEPAVGGSLGASGLAPDGAALPLLTCLLLLTFAAIFGVEGPASAFGDAAVTAGITGAGGLAAAVSDLVRSASRSSRAVSL